MSWLFTRPEGLDEFVNVRATMFDNTRGFTPFIETYASEALPWAKTPALHSFEKLPPMERYAQLVEDFAQSAG
jgi:hypothetical protein